MIRDYLADFDFSLPLTDAVNDPELPAVRSELAALSLPEGLDGGYYEAQELAEAFLNAAREANAGIADSVSQARTILRVLLARRSSYQGALFDAVALLPLTDAAAHLCWLTELMRTRADMYRLVAGVRSR